MPKTLIKVLLIEDDPSDAKLMEHFLYRSKTMAFELECVARLAEGLEYLQNHDVDTVLVDLSLPDSKGLDTFKAVQTECHMTAILVITGFDDESLAIEALKFGAQDYLVKGEVNSRFLERAIQYAIQRKETEQKLERLAKRLEDALQIQNKLNDNLIKSGVALKAAKRHEEAINRDLGEMNGQMELELEQARVTQSSLLPSKLPEFEHAHMAVKYHAITKIGGDFYDILHLDENKVGILIADVTGHGISAALISFMVSGLFKTVAPNKDWPSDTITELNRLLYQKIPEDKFTTAFYCIYDEMKQALHYVTAGHPEAYLLRSSTPEVIPLSSKGVLLGIFPNTQLSKFKTESISLRSGDKLLLYTDGIFEATNHEDHIFGQERLQQCLMDHHFQPIDELLTTLYDAVLEYSGRAEFQDDITLLGLEVY